MSQRAVDYLVQVFPFLNLKLPQSGYVFSQVSGGSGILMDYLVPIKKMIIMKLLQCGHMFCNVDICFGKSQRAVDYLVPILTTKNLMLRQCG